MHGKRHSLFRLATLAAVGAGGMSGMIQRVLAAGLKPVAPGVYRVKGAARINGVQATPGMPVKAGDTVETDAGAELVYVIGQDAYLQREKSVVRFVGEAAADVLRVVTGKLLAVFGKGAKSIQTPTATLGIRGTGCYIEAEPQRVYFCLCYGEAEIAPIATPGSVHRYSTKHHDRPYAIGNTAEGTLTTAPMINHTDVELTLLESLCGRRPPFYGQAGGYV